MITLNTLLEVTNAKEITIRLPLTTRLEASIDVRMNDPAALDDLCGAYGSYIVTSMSHRRDEPTLVVRIMPGPAGANG